MRKISRTLRRNRRNLKKVGWAATGFIFLFCILTVQLSAREGRRPVHGQDSTPPPAPVGYHSQNYSRPINSTQASRQTGARTARADIGNTQYATQPFAAQPYATNQLAPQQYGTQSQYVPQTQYTPQQFGTQPAIVDPSMSPSAVYLQQQPTGVANYPESVPQYPASEVIYEQAQATPSSNYFGIGPDDVCDEWNGFGDCDQKMFTRRGAVCSDKDCLGQNSRLGQRFRSERGCR